ncbi:hypothetical protein Bca4012_030188 [Brassica carinata]
MDTRRQRIDPCSAVANALSIPPGEYQRTLPGLDMPQILLKERGAFGNADTGGAWLSSARSTAGDKPEEGEDDVKSSCPLCPGQHTCYNGRDKGSRSREGELTPKPLLSSDCRLQLACMKPESLVIAGQPYGGEFIPGPCTHRPSHYGSWPCPKSLP